MINLKELLTGDVTRLRYIVRYSTCRRHHNESVAEHSFYVALYSAMLAEVAVSKMLHVNWRKVMMGSTFHDLEESLTGDFPRSFKYSTPELSHVISAAAEKNIMELFRKVNPGYEAGWWSFWTHAKDDSLEGRIVELADFLSVVSYMYQELKAGNLAILEHIDSMREYAAIFEALEFSPFKQIIDQLPEMLDYLTGEKPYVGISG